MKRRLFFRLIARSALSAIAGGVLSLGALTLNAGPAASASPAKTSHLQLVDRLDRPQDGYCLDIPGPPDNLRLQLPLFAHNCMPSLTIDTAIVFTNDGFIRFPSVDRCVTAMGIKAALPGSPVMLAPCNLSTPVMDFAPRQRFTHRNDGRLAIAGTELCLTVGPQSGVTLSPIHRWRPLFVAECATASPARSTWKFVVPRS